jgi:hypothetical protein
MKGEGAREREDPLQWRDLAEGGERGVAGDRRFVGEGADEDLNGFWNQEIERVRRIGEHRAGEVTRGAKVDGASPRAAADAAVAAEAIVAAAARGSPARRRRRKATDSSERREPEEEGDGQLRTARARVGVTRWEIGRWGHVRRSDGGAAKEADCARAGIAWKECSQLLNVYSFSI